MGRKCKFDTHIKPHLDEIKEWTITMTERQIAERLGVGKTAFEKYKKDYPELADALMQGRENLKKELKLTLKKKALGFYYEEEKTTQRNENGKKVVTVEKYKKYAQPDTGALHLLLKNLDEDWRNDDKATLDLKKEQLKLQREKFEEESWTTSDDTKKDDGDADT